jgi:hypothetical protein
MSFVFAICTNSPKVAKQTAAGCRVKKNATHGLQTMRSIFANYPLSRVLSAVMVVEFKKQQ